MEAFTWISLVVIVFHLAGIAAAIDAVWRARTAQGSVAWAVLLVVFPYFTLIPYFIFGSNRFESYVNARRDERETLARHSSALPWKPDDSILPGNGLPAAARLTDMPLLGGNQVRLLVNGEATFQAIFEAIRNAQEEIVVEFFTIADDDLGQQLFSLLRERAAQGVRVYLLCDGIGSHSLPNKVLAELRDAGIKAHKFVTTSGMGVNRFQVNFRNHRKLVVVDGKRAFIGGHNVSDLYVGKEPPLSPWRDTHIELEGPIIGCLQYTFAEDWYWTTKTLPEQCTPSQNQQGGVLCQSLPFGPADKSDTCVLTLLELIHHAEQRIWISTPYLVPDDAVFAALKLAVNRGVEVRLLVPARPDHYVVFYASALFVRRAVENGMQVYRYQPGFVHQKVWLIDDWSAVIGSANLDNRSMRLNFEQMVATFDAEFADQVAQMLLDDFSLARQVTPEQLKSVPVWRQAAERVANLLAPTL